MLIYTSLSKHRVRVELGSVIVGVCSVLCCKLTSQSVHIINPALSALQSSWEMCFSLCVKLAWCGGMGKWYFILNCWTRPLLLELLLVSTPLYVCLCAFPPLFPPTSHFPALTPPVSAVCLARRAGQPRSRRSRLPWTSSTTHRPLRFNRPLRREVALCSSCPATRAKPSISSMRSEW